MIVYTSIFGEGELIEPEYMTAGWKYVCFTDQKFVSDKWDVIRCDLMDNNPLKTSKIYKILPHFFIRDNESIYVDGNFIIRGDLNDFVRKYGEVYDAAFFDHAVTEGDQRYCIYKEAAAVLENNKANRYKVVKQMDRYRSEGHPRNNGLICGGFIFRRHTKTVKYIMEEWWRELSKETMRDQLSFNYIAKKNNFKFNYIPLNIRENKYIIMKYED